jgi:UDP-glucose 4-epimerase
LGPLAGVIPLTAWRILSGMPPEIHGDGKQSRDFIHVQDTVDAVVKLFRVLPAGESVNISTDNQVAIGDLVSRIATILASKEKILFKPARQADVLCHNASNEKVCRLIDYSLTDFESGLRDTLDWYKERFTSNK